MPPLNSIRLRLPSPLLFGPGKAELLGHIETLGSLRAAAEAMEMSYMKAWKLVKSLNEGYAAPVVETHRGGKAQGGATLTENGRELLALYFEAVTAAELAISPMLDRMRERLAEEPVKSTK